MSHNSTLRPMTGFWEHSSEPRVSRKARNFLIILTTTSFPKTLLHGFSYQNTLTHHSAIIKV